MDYNVKEAVGVNKNMLSYSSRSLSRQLGMLPSAFTSPDVDAATLSGYMLSPRAHRVI
jgi:hypothetical protein